MPLKAGNKTRVSTITRSSTISQPMAICPRWLSINCRFFFSSRRRHTISLCDWSSDVCSSDLGDMSGIFEEMFRRRGGNGGGGGGGFGFDSDPAPVTYTLPIAFLIAARGGKQRVTLPNGKTLDIDVPEGATDGQTLRLKGQGTPGVNGRPTGDAYVELRVQPHAFFEARDSNIHVELPVTITEAALGGKVKVPTVGGPVMLNVPAGSNTGTSLRLKGRGLLDKKSGERGDQYVKLKIVLPAEPDDKLKAFLEGWEAGKTHDPRKDMEQFT